MTEERDLSRFSAALAYCPETGSLTWRVTSSARSRAGCRAGCLNGKGYVVVSLNGRQFRASRVAWLLHHGRWPVGVIDHINHDVADNRISNLRDVSIAENTQNQMRAQKRSRSGLLGVFPADTRWGAKLFVGGRAVRLGQFATAEEAHAAYLKAKRLLHAGNTL